jgi:hypothetical protein
MDSTAMTGHNIKSSTHWNRVSISKLQRPDFGKEVMRYADPVYLFYI